MYPFMNYKHDERETPNLLRCFAVLTGGNSNQIQVNCSGSQALAEDSKDE